jgi:fumarate reductase flavoprotein subunit
MQHYSMGGIKVDETGQSPHLKGLFSCGEAACWDLHGFNRLGGNSVAETVVSGMIIGDYVSKYCFNHNLKFDTKLAANFMQEFDEEQDKILANVCDLIHKPNELSIYDIRDKMRKIVMDKVGIFRTKKALQEAFDELKYLHEQSEGVYIRTGSKSANPGLIDTLRVKKMLKLALCITKGALMRTESRGAHTREDFPKRDDANWLKRTITSWKNLSDTEPTVEYEDINIMEMELPPGFRGYGKKGNIIEHKDSQIRLDIIEATKKANPTFDRFEMQHILMPYTLPKKYQAKNERVGIEYE